MSGHSRARLSTFCGLVAVIVVTAMTVTLSAGSAWARVDATKLHAEFFPGSTHVGPATGSPLAHPVFMAGELAGYIFLTRSVVASTGFSGQPLDLAVGLDLSGKITGVQIIEHHEPILEIGVREEALRAFVAQYVGRDVRKPVSVVRQALRGPEEVDRVAGATISSIVMGDTIFRSARAIARTRGIIKESPLDLDSFEPLGWADLLADGSIVSRHITYGEAASLFVQEQARIFPPRGEPDDPESLFSRLYVGLATPARIGANLIDRQDYDRAVTSLSEGEHLLFVGADGLYSFKGVNWVRSGLFDRIQLVQSGSTIRLRKEDYIPVKAEQGSNIAQLREKALFVIPQEADFRAHEPFRVDLIVEAKHSDGTAVQKFLSLSYQIPPDYLIESTTEATAIVSTEVLQNIWISRIPDIVILLVALALLSAILVMQDSVARQQKFYRRLRIGFLSFTLLWIGWYAGAQLSILNVLVFLEALRTDFQWEYFLLDPLVFILWGFTALTLLFWGRGVYCGWLCPFGALQELVFTIGQKLKLPAYELPFALNERLWAIKYLIFLGLFALSLSGLSMIQGLSEVEPFKTAIVLHFLRAWPFVLYVVLLLAVGLFIQRFFCRYVCPLGAALAIPARLHMFEWLHRRWQCGSQCTICAQQCPVNAIHPSGQINPNECIHCLVCQTAFYDDQLCPPMVQQRKRREKLAHSKAPDLESLGVPHTDTRGSAS